VNRKEKAKDICTNRGICRNICFSWRISFTFWWKNKVVQLSHRKFNSSPSTKNEKIFQDSNG